MRIVNKPSFLAAALAFVGTIIIVMDSFGPVHRIVDKLPKWKNINLAVADLDTFDTKMKDGKEIGMVERDKPGFTGLVHIIFSNRPDLRDKKIIAVAKNQPIGIGGVAMKIVHLQFENNPQGYSLTTDYIFHEWIRDYRSKYFLKIGLSVIAIAFLLSVIAHITWKDMDVTQQKDGEVSSEIVLSDERSS